MATLVLGALGTLVGGPIGGAIGALAGRSLDQMIIGSPRREGPRLKDLAISTSSYGLPIPALYGTVRAPGTVIWSTDLKEHRESSGGGKGKPKTTTYSYSVSLAIALSSRPIEGIGRIWADGNLLRGAAGNLKTGGTMRIYTGHADQPADPLMSADIGPQCPAHRGCAYVVFEDLALEDFGNRIPALSFEVFGQGAQGLVADIAARHDIESTQTDFPELGGFVHEGGNDASLLALIDRLRPIGTAPHSGGLAIAGVTRPDEIPVLPEPAAWDEGDFGKQGGEALARNSLAESALGALRYYDPSRDYQPGLQRSEGTDGMARQQVLEFPGVFAASAAQSLLARAATREKQRGEALAWRTSELDPAISPGSIVRAPGMSGLWRVTGWEWRERGVELELLRFVPDSDARHTADSGAGWTPPDRDGVASSLRLFELPWDGTGSSGSIQRYAAVGAPTGRWSGATLYEADGTSLSPIAFTSERAVCGALAAPLAGDKGLRFAPAATLTVQLEDHEAELEPATTTALAHGSNRLLVGDEILQFADAEPQGAGAWLLTGLLRGRGGTEFEALAGHATGAPVTLLDDRLVVLPADSHALTLAAIGLSDDDPVLATLEGVGRTRRPLFPVHPRAETSASGDLRLCWSRRARGGWAWLDEVEQPLAEEVESYDIGIGDPAAPRIVWQTSASQLTLSASDLAALEAAHPGADVWVRQRGSYAKSRAVHLYSLPDAN